ncbi:MAG: helix-hairpin-helix domain-containing protein [Acidobacteriota bacterium]
MKAFRQLAAASIVTLVAGTSVFVAGRAPAAQGLTPSGEGLPDAPGKDVVVRMCGVCHEARRAASVRLTRDGWSSVIDDMVRRGAKGSDQDAETVLDYLATNFLGEAPRPLNINSAAQIDFESVLELLRREAAAVVAYREKHGVFKSVDDLKKVPGLDFKKIDNKRDRIVAF